MRLESGKQSVPVADPAGGCTSTALTALPSSASRSVTREILNYLATPCALFSFSLLPGNATTLYLDSDREL